MPKVSVILPTYKVERYLPQCLDSVVAQTLRDIEIVAVDDGSPDRCGAIVDEYADRDSRIRPVHKKNGGYGSAINAGLAVATGEYISIVETDDLAEADMLDVLYGIASRGAYDIVKGSFYWTGEWGIRKYDLGDHIGGYEGEVEPTRSPKTMCMESSIWSAIFRRSFLAEQDIRMFDSPGASYQDVAWKFLTFATSRRSYFIDYPVYRYRVAAPGSSSASSGNPLAMFENYARLARILTEKGLYGRLERQLYLHQVIDFKFHFERLDEPNRKVFVQRAQATLQDLAKRGIDVFDQPMDPAFARAKARELAPLLAAIRRGSTDPLCARPRRKLAKDWLRFRPVRLAWGGFKRAVGTHPVGPILRKALAIAPPPVIRVPQTRCGKHALAVMPFALMESGETNAYFEVVKRLNHALSGLGYKVHAVVYNPHGSEPVHCWDEFHYLKAVSPRAFQLTRDDAGRTLLDSHRIDDWCGDELAHYVAAADAFWKFDVCLVHYVFLSRVFDLLSPKAAKILYTHDIYSNRNSKLKAHGLESSLWFSTSPEEEKKGLQRADRVLAIQDSEAAFFAGLIGREKVTSLPCFGDKRYLPYAVSGARKLTLGYFGSRYLNNVKTFTDFHGAFMANQHLRESYDIIVGGNVCQVLGGLPASRQVTLKGSFEDVADFYRHCDLCINPDFFESGLKMKGTEAMSFGLPLVTTRQATAGIATLSDFHRLPTMPALLEALEAIAKDRTILAQMATDSRTTYDRLLASYDAKACLSAIIAEHGGRGGC